MLNPFRKKIPAPSPVEVPKGFKVVPPPKSKARRQLIESDDLAASGGCRTVRNKPTVPTQSK
jgi:hypothetical protein